MVKSGDERPESPQEGPTIPTAGHDEGAMAPGAQIGPYKLLGILGSDIAVIFTTSGPHRSD